MEKKSIDNEEIKGQLENAVTCNKEQNCNGEEKQKRRMV